MAKSIGKNKLNCAVFISGRGSNLKSIYNYSKKKNSKINLNLVISNKSNVEGVRFAKKNESILGILGFIKNLTQKIIKVKVNLI